MSDAPPEPERLMFQRAVAAGRSNVLTAPLLLATGLLATLAVTHALSPPVFAVYAAVIAFRGLMGYLGDLGAGVAANRTFAQLQARAAGAQARRVFLRLALLRIPPLLALVLALVLLPQQIGDLVGLAPDERDVLPAMAVIGVFEVLGSLGGYALQGTFNHRALNRCTLAGGILQPVAVILAAALGLGVTGIVAGVALGSLVRNGGMLASAVIALRRMPSHGEEVQNLAGAYAKVAGGALVGKAASMAHQRQVLTFVGLATFSRTEVAGFALAYDFAQQALTAVFSPVYSLLTPALSAAQGDRAATERTFRFLLRLIALAVVPLAAVLTVMLPLLVPTLFGARYEDAVVFGYIFLPAYAIEAVLTGPAASAMLADEALVRPYRNIKIVTLLTALLYVPLVGWSLVAAAVFMMVARVGSALAMHVVLHRRTGLTAWGRWVLPLALTTLAAAGGAGVAELVLPDGVVGLVGAAIGAVLCGLAAARLTRLVEDRDIELLGQALPAAIRPLQMLKGGPQPPRVERAATSSS